MTPKSLFIALTIVIALTSCITFRAIEQRITFDDNFEMGSAIITIEDIGSRKFNYNFSDKNKAKKQSPEEIDTLKQEDFSELLEWYEGDEVLLDEVKRGVYVKERKLYEKGGKLHFSYSGIFNKYAVDEGEELKVLEDIITITFELENDIENVETNGMLERKEKLVTITWPKTEKEIYWKLIYNNSDDSGSPIYSLIDNYRSWKNRDK